VSITSYLSTAARTVAHLPIGLLRSGQVKLAAVFAGYVGVVVGAQSRIAGETPASIVARVRDGMITADGQLVEQERTYEPTPFHEAAADVVDPWVADPLFTFPESWNAAAEQAVIVPMIRILLSVVEAGAGVGYWLAGFTPPQVIGYGGLVVIGGVVIVHLWSLRGQFE